MTETFKPNTKIIFIKRCAQFLGVCTLELNLVLDNVHGKSMLAGRSEDTWHGVDNPTEADRPNT